MTDRLLRTFARVYPFHGRHPGLADEGEMIDVTSFGPTAVRYRVEGNPPVDDLWLDHDAWERLGQPDRIEMEIRAADRITVGRRWQ